jgi:hypothetical protein
MGNFGIKSIFYSIIPRRISPDGISSSMPVINMIKLIFYTKKKKIIFYEGLFFCSKIYLLFCCPQKKHVNQNLDQYITYTLIYSFTCQLIISFGRKFSSISLIYLNYFSQTFSSNFIPVAKTKNTHTHTPTHARTQTHAHTRTQKRKKNFPL